MPARPTAIIWAHPHQEVLIRDALSAGDFTIHELCGPSSSATAALERSFDAPVNTDLRAAIQNTDADLLFLAAPDAIEPDVHRIIRERRVRTISCHPRPSALPAVFSDAEEHATIRFAPLMRSSQGFRRARDVLEQIGEVRIVQITFTSDVSDGSLLARLFDAVDIIETLAGGATTIDAVCTGDRAGLESLETLRGDLCAIMRFGDSRAASLAISSGSGPWLRRVSILAEHGRVTFTDDDLEWITPDGTVADQHRSDTHTSPGALVGWQIRHWLDEMDSIDHPPDNPRLMALCEAARLSCRTGQPESPGRMLELMGRP